MNPADAWTKHWQQFGEFIREQRRNAELSQRQLANLVNLSDTYMSQLERGLHEPSIRVLCSLAEGLGLGVEQMLLVAARLDAHAGTNIMGAKEPSEIGTETAILADPRLSAGQKQALLAVLRSYLAGEHPDATAEPDESTSAPGGRD